MANLPESSTFDAGVYQLETTDPVVGGASGISNTPLKNLANRTKYLKDQLDALPAAIAAAYAPIASPTFTGDPKAPTPAQFDNDTTLATTAFVQRALGSNSSTKSYSANATLPASDVGKLVVASASGGFTLTLPAASAAKDGGAIEIFNGAGSAITVQRAGADTIWVDTNGYTKTSFSVGSGDTLRVISNGSSGWILADCSVSATYSALFTSSKATNGYQKLPSGLIIQWGTFGATFGSTAASSQTVTLTMAFPNAIFHVGGALGAGIGEGYLSFTCENPTTTQFTLRAQKGGGGTANIGFRWIAIGS